jgi:hypothetical protein
MRGWTRPVQVAGRGLARRLPVREEESYENSEIDYYGEFITRSPIRLAEPARFQAASPELAPRRPATLSSRVASEVD